MKLLIAGLAAGLLVTGAPVWADSWKNESAHPLRQTHWERQRSRSYHREERHHGRHERFERRWERRHERFDRGYYYEPPATRHYYYYRDYSYGYPAARAYIETPSVYFSWSY